MAVSRLINRVSVEASLREVQAFVRELRDHHDATILLTTHDMQEADVLCDRIAIIDDGRIVALDTPAR